MRVFADTVYWIALLNPHDQHHAAAVAVPKLYRSDLVTSDLVAVEVLNHCSGRGQRLRQIAHAFVMSLKTSPDVSVVSKMRDGSDLISPAIDFYGARLDKSWSVVDCSSILIMQELRLTYVLTNDYHFQQAGFTALLCD